MYILLVLIVVYLVMGLIGSLLIHKYDYIFRIESPLSTIKHYILGGPITLGIGIVTWQTRT